MQDFAKALKRISNQTGVSSLEEVIEKCSKHVEENQALLDKERNGQNKLISLLAKKDQLQQQLEEAKSGDGNTLASYDNMEREQNAMVEKLESMKVDRMTLQNLQVELRNGVIMLSDKISLSQDPADSLPQNFLKFQSAIAAEMQNNPNQDLAGQDDLFKQPSSANIRIRMMEDDDRKHDSDSDNEDELFGKQRGPSRIGSRKR